MEENKIELLEEILRQQKKEVRHSRIVSCFCLVLVAALLTVGIIVAPRIIRIANKAETSIDTFDTFMSESQQTLSKVNSFVNGANDLLADNTQALSEAIEKLNSVDYAALGETLQQTGTTLRQTGEKLQSIDFETLNNAIRELESVVKPLSDFFSVFQ